MGTRNLMNAPRWMFVELLLVRLSDLSCAFQRLGYLLEHCNAAEDGHTCTLITNTGKFVVI